ncbi:MAG TPA: glycosyltransferase [Hellea balneolensis]|uniref:Glycosyltransferase n=1 Tax=Hellea balneolensis TaxID=287478 RepID=A0A7C5R1Q9_9PROT|nr:glycosyltransferase [Hellea balneolensis]
MKPVLVIFVKAPRLGQVKTRLARDIGHVHARRIYRAMSAKIIREMCDKRWQTVLYITPDMCVNADFGGLWPRGLPRMAQGDGDLSPRTARIFSSKGPVITIGTDTPSMKKQYIADGFKALKTHKAVIGPAKDGGFWLLGLNGPVPARIFEGVRWSHPQTCQDMASRVPGTPAFLPMLNDIDTLQDWLAYQRPCDKPFKTAPIAPV